MPPKAHEELPARENTGSVVEPAFSAASEGPEGAPPKPTVGGVQGTWAEPQVVGAEGP